MHITKRHLQFGISIETSRAKAILAVDFFFLLPWSVIGSVYNDRWNKMTPVFKGRIERLRPLVVLGMPLFAIGFYFLLNI